MPTTNSTIQFKHGLQETFSNITKDSNTIYFITDTNRLFVGDSEYTRPVQHGSELPTSKNPANSLFVKETGTSRELYYSKDGTAWDMIAYLPATITGGVFGDNTAGTVAYGGTVKVPKVTVDNRGYVTAAEDVTITLPTSDKVTTVTTTGDGNAVTSGSISNDGTTLTLTKGTSFVPSTGGTFSGDITVSGNLTADDIKTSGEINITPNDNETTVDVQFLNGGDSFDNDTTVSIESEYVPHSPAPGVPANSNKTYLKLNSDVTQINSDTTEITGALNVSGQINGLDIESENQNNVYTRTISDIGVSAYVEFERANGDHNLNLNADDNIDLDASNINLNGNVTLSSAPSNNMHAATKKYVDDAVTAATLTWKTF